MSDLTASNDESHAARRPRQERSANRMSKVLKVTERLLEEVGPEKTSVPAIAEAAGVPRSAIYPFFPDKYAIFARLAELHMAQLAKLLNAPQLDSASTWQEWAALLIKAIADYYNHHPAASILLLRGAFTELDRNAHAAKNEAIGALFREKVLSFGEVLDLPREPDVAILAVEIAFACMKHGYALEGSISDAICTEAVRATEAYMCTWAKCV